MQKLSLLIYWCCNLVLVASPLILVFSIFNTAFFTNLIKNALHLNIQWSTVQSFQWIMLWCLIAAFFSLGYAGVYFLRKSFRRFAAGDWFNLDNGLNIRLFAKLLLIQSIATPLVFSISGLILSFNHPAGQKILAISLGANELKGVVVALIFLIVSHILVLGNTIDNENKEFL